MPTIELPTSRPSSSHQPTTADRARCLHAITAVATSVARRAGALAVPFAFGAGATSVATVTAVSPLAAQVRPVIAIHGTSSEGRAGGGADDVYGRLGGLGSGHTAGLGVGLLVHGRFGFIAFGESGRLQTGTAGGGTATDVTRTTFGARMEFPVARLPLGVRGLVATTLFVQELTPVDVRLVPGGTLAIASPGDPTATALSTRSLGGRFEVGVERRIVLGTGLFVLAGVTAIGGAHGSVERVAAPGGTGGVSFAPIVTAGLRTRAW